MNQNAKLSEEHAQKNCPSHYGLKKTSAINNLKFDQPLLVPDSGACSSWSRVWYSSCNWGRPLILWSIFSHYYRKYLKWPKKKIKYFVFYWMIRSLQKTDMLVLLMSGPVDSSLLLIWAYLIDHRKHFLVNLYLHWFILGQFAKIKLLIKNLTQIIPRIC